MLGYLAKISLLHICKVVVSTSGCLDDYSSSVNMNSLCQFQSHVDKIHCMLVLISVYFSMSEVLQLVLGHSGLEE